MPEDPNTDPNPNTDTETDPNPNTDTQPELTAAEWRDKFYAEAAQSKKRRQRAQAAEAERDDLKTRAITAEDAEEFARLKADVVEREQADAEAERAQMEKKGEWEELRKQDANTHKAAMAQKDKSHQADLDKKDEESARLAGIVAKLGAENPLQAALADANVQSISHAVFYIQHSPDSEYHVISGLDEQGQPTPKVVDREGNEVVDPNKAGSMMTIEGLVQWFIGTEFGQRFLPPSGDTGSGAKKGGSGSENLEAIMGDVEKRMAHMQSVGGQEYVRQTLNRKSRLPAAT